jgi:hypothetical protein
MAGGFLETLASRAAADAKMAAGINRALAAASENRKTSGTGL